MRSVRKASRDDEGFGLVEMLVSLAVMSTALAAMGPFFVRSMQSVDIQRSTQAATEVANTAIEQVRALKGSSLLGGRGETRSTAQWDGAPAGLKASYLNTMQLVWDETLKDTEQLTLGDEAPVPTASKSMLAEGIVYTRAIYVGSCDVFVTRTATSACVNPVTTPKPRDLLQELKFFRVVVLVTWAGSRDCLDKAVRDSVRSRSCNYVASTLVSRGTEPTFDFHRAAPLIETTGVTFYRNVANTYELKAKHGQLPNTWSAPAASLPAGLALAPTTGVVAGTPSALVTNMPVQVTVTDKLGRSDTETVYFTVVNPPALTVPTGAHMVGDAVSQALSTTGGVAPYEYTASNLPPGLMLNTTTGAITGTPTTAGTFTVTVTSADNNPTPSVSTAGKVERTYTHVIYPALALATIADQTITLGSTFSATAAASGGSGSFTYSAAGLPIGVLINPATGAMSGLPTISGRYLPTVTVTDGLGHTATRTFVLVVNTVSNLVFTSPVFTAADRTSARGVATSVSFQTNAALLGLSPTLSATGLPPGLTFNVLTRTISGTPTAAGVYKVTVLAVNALPPQTSNLTFLWTIT